MNIETGETMPLTNERFTELAAGYPVDELPTVPRRPVVLLPDPIYRAEVAATQKALRAYRRAHRTPVKAQRKARGQRRK